MYRACRSNAADLINFASFPIYRLTENDRDAPVIARNTYLRNHLFPNDDLDYIIFCIDVQPSYERVNNYTLQM